MCTSLTNAQYYFERVNLVVDVVTHPICQNLVLLVKMSNKNDID